MYGENGLVFVGTDFRTAFRARAGVAGADLLVQRVVRIVSH